MENLNELAKQFIDKNPAAKRDIIDYIRYGRGYSDPTDLFDNEISGFSEGNEEEINPLYSVEGAIALMDACW